MFSSTLIIAFLVFVVGMLALWANPTRSINRAFFTSSLNIMFWLFCLHAAFESQIHGVTWLKLASSVGGLLPLHLWFVKGSVLSSRPAVLSSLRSLLPWCPFGLFLVVVPFTDWFIPTSSTPEHRIYGPGYYGYLLVSLLLYAIFSAQSVTRVRNETGMRRVELQLLLMGFSATAVTTVLLVGLNAVFRDAIYIRLAPFGILGFYTLTVWTMTTSKVFDAGHMLRVGGHYLTNLTACAVAAITLFQLLVPHVSEIFAAVLAVVVALLVNALLQPWLQSLFGPDVRTNVEVRRAAFDAARRESRVEGLAAAFEAVVQAWAHTDLVRVLFAENGNFQERMADCHLDTDLVDLIKEERWVTPERLARERPRPERDRLTEWMRQGKLGALIYSGSGSLSLIVTVGVRPSRRPFTYPQITQLVELTSIFENALARTYFSAKAQQAEQLATVGMLGASLAHEIRNPLVSIKTFVQLLPRHYSDPVFREKFFRLIGAEADRIDRLTVQLLELAAPRNYSGKLMALHPVIHEALDLVGPKAQDQGISIRTELNALPDRIFNDPGAAKQVILNLCFNAVQAFGESNLPGERWFRLETRLIGKSVEMTIADNGPGIRNEVREQLFEPFHSTKSTGFGLGLAICRDILSGLHASITVDPAEPGKGATFRVLFPCQPPTS